MMRSLNEIEAMAKRAVRGAGLAWGLAEEAGKALRWLTEHDQPGAQMLAQLLVDIDGKAYSEIAPVSEKSPWHASGGPLCPIACGAALSDRAQEITAGHVIELGPTRQPLLLAPCLASAARLGSTAIELTWDGVTMIMMADGVYMEGSQAALTSNLALKVRCRATQRNAISSPAHTCARAVATKSWNQLHAFAQRTYAPASEASRISGAGAALKDDD
jgi:hypothetical protein